MGVEDLDPDVRRGLTVLYKGMDWSCTKVWNSKTIVQVGEGNLILPG